MQKPPAKKSKALQNTWSMKKEDLYGDHNPHIQQFRAEYEKQKQSSQKEQERAKLTRRGSARNTAALALGMGAPPDLTKKAW